MKKLLRFGGTLFLLLILAGVTLWFSFGLGAFKGKAWRIGLMGHSARQENVLALLGALERVLHKA